MGKKFKIICIIISAVVLLTACNYQQNMQNPTDEHNDETGILEENNQPIKGGILKLQSSKSDTLNPLLTKNNINNAQILSLIFEGLVTYDEDLNIKPLLAESWDASVDGTEWTFFLKRDVLWHDNVPFTAEDVNYSMKVIANNKYNSVYKFNMQYISHFNVVDRHTFRVVLNRPYGNFLSAMVFPIVARHQFEGKEDQVGNKDGEFKPVGTGPYKFSEYISFREIKLVMNDNWWKEQTPYIDTIMVKLLPDTDTVLFSLDAKEVDLVPTKEIDWDKYSAKENIKIKEFITNQYEFIAVNFNNKVLRDDAVRKAMAYAINKEEIIKDALLGHGIKTDIPFNTESWLYNPECEIYDFNIEKAKEILEQSGWTDLNNDGILEKLIDGVSTPLSFEIMTNNDNAIRVKVLENIVKQLRVIGMDVIEKSVEWNNLNSLLNSKRFDAVLMGLDLYPNTEMLFAFHSSEITRGSNYISYNDPVMDKLLETAFETIDSQQRKQAYSNLQNYIVEQLPYISLYFTTSAVLYNNRLKGHISPTFFNIYNGIEDWYIAK